MRHSKAGSSILLQTQRLDAPTLALCRNKSVSSRAPQSSLSSVRRERNGHEPLRRPLSDMPVAMEPIHWLLRPFELSSLKLRLITRTLVPRVPPPCPPLRHPSRPLLTNLNSVRFCSKTAIPVLDYPGHRLDQRRCCALQAPLWSPPT
jgi:hypothetical protein